MPASPDALRAEALANDGDSQFQLGEMLLNNPTDMNDLVDAYAWFVLADRNGHARARYYKRGMGNVLDEEQQQQVAERVADLTAAIEEARDPDAAEDGSAAADVPVADATAAVPGRGESGQADEGEGAEAPAGAPANGAGGPDVAASADPPSPVPAVDAAATAVPADDAGGRVGQGAEPAAADDTAEAPADTDGPEVRQPEAAAPGVVPPDSLDTDSPAGGVSDGGGGSTTGAVAQDPHPRAEQPQTEPRSQDEETAGAADQPEAAGSRGMAPDPAQDPAMAPDPAQGPAMASDPAQGPGRESADAAAVPGAPAPAAATGGTGGVAGSAAAAPAAPDVAPGSRSVAAVDPGALVVRGKALLAQGDIVSARALFELAAESGSGEAALLTGRTYDPAFVAEHKAVGFRGDAEQARHWYRMAIEMGATEAQAALDELAR